MLITPEVPQQAKTVGQFTAIPAVHYPRWLDDEIETAIRNTIDGPLAIDSIQLVDIESPQAYEQAVEGRTQAIVAEQQAEAEEQQPLSMPMLQWTKPGPPLMCRHTDRRARSGRSERDPRARSCYHGKYGNVCNSSPLKVGLLTC